MSVDERPIPPGPGRTAAAARVGLFPKSDAIPGGLALVAIGGIGRLFSPWWLNAIHDLFVDGIGSATLLNRDPRTAAAHLLEQLGQLVLPLLAILFFSALLGTLWPLFISRKGSGYTAVPLPKFPSGRFTITVIRIFGTVIFVLMAYAIIIKPRPVSAAQAWGTLTLVSASACELMAALGGVMLLMGVIELTLMRHLIYRALHLSTTEARQEIRASEGDPHIRRRMLSSARNGARR